jgi:hypothetical protein
VNELVKKDLIRKGVLRHLANLSPLERKLLIILGLIQSRKIKTKGEEDVQEFLREKSQKVSASAFNDLEKLAMNKHAQNEIRNAIGKITSMGLTKKDIQNHLGEMSGRLKKLAVTAAQDTDYPPETQEFAVYNCPSCGFTIDALQDLPPEKLTCRYCGTKMRGLTREEFQNKAGYDKEFNTDEEETGSKKQEQV